MKARCFPDLQTQNIYSLYVWTFPIATLQRQCHSAKRKILTNTGWIIMKVGTCHLQDKL